MVIFYTTHCVQCGTLKNLLDKYHIEYTTIDDMQVMIDKGIKYAPALEVDNQIMNMAQAMKWVKENGIL
jgi:glutaredoxin